MFESPLKTKKFLKIALFGKGGTGKTRAALSFPGACVIDSERGTDPYREKYKFKVIHANRWKQLGAPIKYLKEHPGEFETLVIDSCTVFYGDLINDIVEAIKAKRGNETMTRGDWGVEKRRFAAFLNMLIELPMHIILCFRGKDEYIETTNRQGEEILKKTGEEYPEADKQVEFLFDLAFRTFTEENKKEKSSKFFMACTKSRYDWMPKYSVHDVTKKRPYDAIFKKHVEEMLDAPDAPKAPEEPVAEKLVDEMPAPVEATKTSEGDKRVEEVKKHFGVTADNPLDPISGGNGEPSVGPGDEYGVPATADEIKVLMTRVGQVCWPDGSKFTSAQGKAMIKKLYGLESTKELRKFQFEFLFREFGEVLAGRARLALEEGDFPIVERQASVT